MMDLQTIRELSNDAGKRARRAKTEPAEITPDSYRHLPNLGTYLPKGWERVSLEELDHDTHRKAYMGDNEGFGAYFVDKGNFGDEDEPAMTLREFLAVLRPGYAYGVVEEGQFQIKVGVFRRKA